MSWRTDEASQFFCCFAKSKVLRSTDLILQSFSFKSMECITKIQMYEGRCIGGEVGGFKHLHVEKKTQQLHGLPPVVRISNVKRAGNGFFFCSPKPS